MANTPSEPCADCRHPDQSADTLVSLEPVRLPLPTAWPAKSCLKQGPIHSPSTAPTKTVTWKGDSSLAACIKCGTGVTKTPNKGRIRKRKAHEIADDKSPHLNDSAPYARPPPPRREDAVRFKHQDWLVFSNTRLAEKRRLQLKEEAIKSGWVDFALYVVRSDRSKMYRRVRENVRLFSSVKVKSYSGFDREHMRWGGVKSTVPQERYNTPQKALSLRMFDDGKDRS